MFCWKVSTHLIFWNVHPRNLEKIWDNANNFTDMWHYNQYIRINIYIYVYTSKQWLKHLAVDFTSPNWTVHSKTPLKGQNLAFPDCEPIECGKSHFSLSVYYSHLQHIPFDQSLNSMTAPMAPMFFVSPILFHIFTPSAVTLGKHYALHVVFVWLE